MNLVHLIGSIIGLVGSVIMATCGIFGTTLTIVLRKEKQLESFEILLFIFVATSVLGFTGILLNLLELVR